MKVGVGVDSNVVSMLQLLRASCFSALAEVCSHVIYGVDRYLPVEVYLLSNA